LVILAVLPPASTAQDAFNLALTQAAPGAPVVFTNTGGHPLRTAINVFTLPGAVSLGNGWFHGLPIPPAMLSLELSLGIPFIVTPDANGGAVSQFPPVPAPIDAVIPPGIAVWVVAISVSPDYGSVLTDAPFAYVTA
jgi:hypothetical protein